MNNWLQNLKTVDWWIGVVIVGVVINIFSAYLKRPIDAILTGISRTWSTRTGARRRARDSGIQRMKGNKDEQNFMLIQSLHVRVRAVMAILFGMILLSSSLLLKEDSRTLVGFSRRSVIAFLSLLPMMFGFSDWFDVIRMRDEIDQARKEEEA